MRNARERARIRVACGGAVHAVLGPKDADHRECEDNGREVYPCPCGVSERGAVRKSMSGLTGLYYTILLVS